MYININGQDYELTTTLRVAYNIQGMNNHKSYLDVFKEVETMPVEKQIEMIYASFKCRNANVMKCQDFQDYILDNFNLKEMLEILQGIIKGIVGDDGEAEAGSESTETAEGNE